MGSLVTTSVVVWAIVIAYVARMSIAHKRLESRIAAIESRVCESAGGVSLRNVA